MLGSKTLACVTAANLRRRRVETLRTWFNELNCWEWPKVFGGKVEENRSEIMNEILHELGIRMLKAESK